MSHADYGHGRGDPGSHRHAHVLFKIPLTESGVVVIETVLEEHLKIMWSKPERIYLVYMSFSESKSGLDCLICCYVAIKVCYVDGEYY